MFFVLTFSIYMSDILSLAQTYIYIVSVLVYSQWQQNVLYNSPSTDWVTNTDKSVLL